SPVSSSSTNTRLGLALALLGDRLTLAHTAESGIGCGPRAITPGRKYASAARLARRTQTPDFRACRNCRQQREQQSSRNDQHRQQQSRHRPTRQVQEADSSFLSSRGSSLSAATSAASRGNRKDCPCTPVRIPIPFMPATRCGYATCCAPLP